MQPCPGQQTITKVSTTALLSFSSRVAGELSRDLVDLLQVSCREIYVEPGHW